MFIGYQMKKKIALYLIFLLLTYFKSNLSSFIRDTFWSPNFRLLFWLACFFGRQKSNLAGLSVHRAFFFKNKDGGPS